MFMRVMHTCWFWCANGSVPCHALGAARAQITPPFSKETCGRGVASNTMYTGVDGDLVVFSTPSLRALVYV